MLGVIIVLFSAILLLCGYLTSFMESDKPWVLTAGLVMPIIYIINVIIFLILIIRAKFILSSIPFLVLLLTFNTTTAMFGINVFKRYDDSKSKFKVATYNVHGFRNDQWIFKFDSIMNDIDSINADILCLQEFETFNVSLDSIQKRLPKLKYAHTHISDSVSTTQKEGRGTAILSRYPLINLKNIDFEESDNRCQIANIIINRDTLTIINAHLQSSGINITDANHIRNIQDSLMMLKDSSVYKQTIVPLYQKLVKSNSKRKNQADEIADYIQNSKYPVILCGDFNSVPSSYTYRTFTSKCDLEDPFLKFGVGYESTYKQFNNLLRIDYILHSEQYESVSFYVPQFEFSDHYPVVVEFTKTK
ncbi:MAG: endonuclease/exonuclease/phosphatase family protein [Rikenellaceae bacterium]